MLHTHIVLQKRIHVSALISSSFLLVLSSLALFPVASSYSDTLAAPAPSETTLSMTSENINLDFSVGVNGAFNVSDPADLSVVTNNFSGYTLSILASSTDETATKLLNGEYAFNSISTTSSADDFNVGNWGIRPSKVNSTDNTDFIPAPTTEGTVLDATSVANANAANTYTIALGAKADYSLPAGRYSNSFVVTAVANPVGYAINYDANTEDTVTDMPDDVSGELSENDVYVSDLVPVRTGYVFNNWCDGNVTSSNGIDSCDGTVYEPGDVFSTTMLAQNILNLYAMWNHPFTLYFDANGGTGTMTPQTIVGASANINENLFTRNEYNFSGWNTASDGTGTAYASGAVYTVPVTGTSDTLYAQWTPISYNITYTLNGGSVSTANPTTYNAGMSAFTLNNPTRTGYTFKGWSGTGLTGDANTTVTIVSGSTGDRAYTANWTANTYTISYAGNGNTGGSMANTTCTYDQNCTLRSNAFTRTQYVFNGWRYNNTNYTNGQTVKNLAASGIVTMTAQWTPTTFDMAFAAAGKSKITINGSQYYKMQDMTSSICSSVYTSTASNNSDTQQSILADSRDNKTYWVAKLKDGKCWMTQNLDHNIVTTANYYTPSNTDITANWTPVRATINATGGTISGWTNDSYTPYSVDIGNWYWSGNYSSTGYNFLSKGENSDFKKSSFSANGAHGHLGNYYNWTAAVAMNDTNSYTTNTEVQTSICPKGWRLPANSTNDYSNLVTSYGNNTSSDTTIIASPLYFVRGGDVYSGNLNTSAGSTGYYMSATLSSTTTGIYTLRLNSSGVAPLFNNATASRRNYGFTIRCVAR